MTELMLSNQVAIMRALAVLLVSEDREMARLLTGMANDVEDEMETKGEPTSTREIEIAPAMMEAGINELVGFNRDFDSERSIVCHIYLAMERARLNHASKPEATTTRCRNE